MDDRDAQPLQVLALAGVLRPEGVVVLPMALPMSRPGRPGVQLQGHRLLGPVRVEAAQVGPARQTQVDVPDRIGQAVLPDHPVEPVLRDRPALRHQRVHRVHHVRPAQQPRLGQLTYHRGRFAVPGADRLRQQPPYRARVRQLRHRVGEGARHRGDRDTREVGGGRQRRRTDDAGAAVRAQPAQPGDQDVDLVEGGQRGRRGEPVQGQRRQARDQRVRVRPRGVRFLGARLDGDARRRLDCGGAAREQQDGVEAFLGGGRPRVEEEDAGEDLKL